MERQKVVACGSMTYRIVAAGEEFYALQCADTTGMSVKESDRYCLQFGDKGRSTTGPEAKRSGYAKLVISKESSSFQATARPSPKIGMSHLRALATPTPAIAFK